MHGNKGITTAKCKCMRYIDDSVMASWGRTKCLGR